MMIGAGIRFEAPYREGISENFDNLSKGSFEPVSDYSVVVETLGICSARFKLSHYAF